MIYDKIINWDIKTTLDNLRITRYWLEQNIETISVAKLKKIRQEIESMEIAIQIYLDDKETRT